MQPKTEAAHRETPTALTGNELRVAVTRQKICDAVTVCLDELGYSETSINRVQQRAGVSRGALTHHFPSKEDMMVETLERLLDPVRGQSIPGRPARDGFRNSIGRGDGIARDMGRLWRKVVNTREGRALVEILVASRTNTQLRQRIAPSLQTYNEQINRNILNLYASPKGKDDVPMLWSICRTFLRGLHTHVPYETDPAQINQMIERFGQIMAPHMSAQPKDGAQE